MSRKNNLVHKWLKRVRGNWWLFPVMVKKYAKNLYELITCIHGVTRKLFPCTVNSKINVTPKGVYIPKLHSILAVVNLLAHNNKSQICYCGQISLQSAAVNCSFSDTFRGTIYFAGDGTCQCLCQEIWSNIPNKASLCEIISKWSYMITSKSSIYCHHANFLGKIVTSEKTFQLIFF